MDLDTILEWLAVLILLISIWSVLIALSPDDNIEQQMRQIEQQMEQQMDRDMMDQQIRQAIEDAIVKQKDRH